jgi:hypothetical protein
MTRKLNTDNGLQRRTTEHQPVTAVWRNGGCSASYDCFVVGASAVLLSQKDFKTILTLGDMIPQNILLEDEQLLMYYDIAKDRV